MSNTVEWEQRPAQERQERTRLYHSQENVSLFSLLKYRYGFMTTCYEANYGCFVYRLLGLT